jgi:tetratricopeptide (TPR) repeat protein
MGDFERAGQLFAQIRDRWPDNLGTARDAALLPLLQGRDEEAMARSLELASRFPAYAGSWMIAGDAHLLAGDLQRAREYYARAYEISPEGYYPVYTFRSNPVTLGYTLWQAGQREAARALFQEFEAFARREISRGVEYSGFHYSLAALHAIQGDKPEAYRWLAEAIELGWSDHIFLSRDPLFENLWDDVEFQRILARKRGDLERERARLERPGTS